MAPTVAAGGGRFELFSFIYSGGWSANSWEGPL